MFKDWTDILAAVIAVLIVLAWLAPIPWTMWKDRRWRLECARRDREWAKVEEGFATARRERLERRLARDFMLGEDLEKLL